MKFLPLFTAGILLFAGCAGAPSREPATPGAPPVSRPSTGPALPGITGRPGAVVPPPSHVTGT
ncbi:MAG: hypothetical protein IH610_12600, partial [Deltaproteobacteria bacterium]|nr:hypothetical protein [Deltaproteobacteria bacterium]